MNLDRVFRILKTLSNVNICGFCESKTIKMFWWEKFFTFTIVFTNWIEIHVRVQNHYPIRYKIVILCLILFYFISTVSFRFLSAAFQIFFHNGYVLMFPRLARLCSEIGIWFERTFFLPLVCEPVAMLKKLRLDQSWQTNIFFIKKQEPKAISDRI